MKRIFAGLIALVALAPTGAVRAADILSKASPPATVMPQFSWTGFYVGGNAGGAWNADPTVAFTPNDLFSTNLTAGKPISFGLSGPLGGLQIGYNWQLDQTLLLGVESDFDFSLISGSGTASFFSPIIGGLGNAAAQTANEQVQWFGTVRGRAGYLATNNLLIYGTAGFAYGKVVENASYLNPGPRGAFIGGLGSCLTASTCYSGTSALVSTGWTAGTGLEFALASNWTVKAEYLYVSFGGSNTFTERNLPSTFVPPPSASITAHFGDSTFHVVRIGMNYKF